MPEWLNLEQTFFTIGIISTALYAIKLVIFIFVGGDVEIDSDFDVTTETDTSFNFLSVQSVLAFLMGMGWSGLAALKQFGLSSAISIVIAIAVGLIFMFGTAYLMFSIKKLNKIIKIDYTTLVGKTGKAYTSLSPHKEGQIQIDVNEKLSFLTAINDSDEEISSFTPVKVTKVENDQIYVIKGE